MTMGLMNGKGGYWGMCTFYGNWASLIPYSNSYGSTAGSSNSGSFPGSQTVGLTSDPEKSGIVAQGVDNFKRLGARAYLKY